MVDAVDLGARRRAQLERAAELCDAVARQPAWTFGVNNLPGDWSRAVRELANDAIADVDAGADWRAFYTQAARRLREKAHA